MRLRSTVSQGIAFPLSILSEDSPLEVGSDVTEILGVKQYLPPIPVNLSGEMKGNFPGFVPKTDETRAQVLQAEITQHKGTPCYVSEKVDGSSVTYFYKDGEFGACSRNWELKDTEGNLIWKMARELKLEEKLKAYGRNVALQGEIIGQGINGNNLKIKK